MSYSDGIQTFAKFAVPMEDLNMIIREYAILSSEPIEKSIDAFWATRKRSDFVRSIRRGIRKYTLTPLEKIVAGN